MCAYGNARAAEPRPIAVRLADQAANGDVARGGLVAVLRWLVRPADRTAKEGTIQARL